MCPQFPVKTWKMLLLFQITIIRRFQFIFDVVLSGQTWKFLVFFFKLRLEQITTITMLFEKKKFLNFSKVTVGYKTVLKIILKRKIGIYITGTVSYTPCIIVFVEISNLTKNLFLFNILSKSQIEYVFQLRAILFSIKNRI